MPLIGVPGDQFGNSAHHSRPARRRLASPRLRRRGVCGEELLYYLRILHGARNQYPLLRVANLELLRVAAIAATAAYWIVGLLTLIAEIVLVPRGQYFDKLASPLAYGAGLDLSSLPLSIIFYIGVSLATMLGLDTGLWLGFDRVGGALSIAPNFAPARPSVTALNPVPQGWTIGLELLFYAMAPFIVRRPIWVIGLFCVFSLAFRLGMMALGFSGEAWNRTLFPSELIYFLLGVLGYRLYLILPQLKLSAGVETAFRSRSWRLQLSTGQ